MPKGDAVLTYEDPNAAHKSVEHFTGAFVGLLAAVVFCCVRLGDEVSRCRVFRDEV